MIGGPTSDIYIEKFEGAGTAGITHNGIEITPTTYVIYLNPNNGDRINVRVRTKEFEKYVSFTNVKLVVKAPYYEANRVLYLTKETSTVSNDNQRLGDFVTEDGLTFEYDLSKYFEENDRETLYFAIRTETAIQILGPAHADGIKVIFNRLEQCQGLINQKFISGNAGRALSYDINLRTGQPFFVKNLVSAGGNLMPLNLNLVFNGIGANEEIFTGMPHGWKTNYHQKVEKDEDNDYYTYVDALGIRHTFNKALNANNIYFDIAGTGFILTVNSDNTVTIDQGYKNYLDFNTNGYLVKIRKEVGINTIQTTINYNTANNSINSIVDGMGRTLTFTYNSTNIKIDMVGVSQITLIKDGNNRLDEIDECGGRCSYYSYSNNLLTTASSDNGEKSQFIYDDDCRVVTVEDYYCKDTETLVNRRKIKYIISKTIVTDYKGIETQYGFSNEGECICEFEVTSKGVGKYVQTIKNDFETYRNIVNRHKYFTYEDKISEFGYVLAPQQSLVGNISVTAGKTYLISFTYELEDNCTNHVLDDHQVVIEQNYVKIKYINLHPGVRGKQNMAVLFNSISDGPFLVWAVFNENSGGKTILSNIKIYEVKQEEVHECVSFSCGTDWGLTYNQGVWNQIPENMSFSYYDAATNTNKQIQTKMYLRDIHETQDNYKRNSDCYHTWYNKKRGLVANTKNVKLITNSGQREIGGFSAAIVYITNKGKYWRYNQYPSTVSDPVNLHYEIETILRGGVYNSSRKVINTDYKVVAGYGFDGIQYSYTYDSYGNVLTYSYGNNSNKNTMVNTYSSDSKYLISQKKYVGNAQASTTSYAYDSLGRMTTLTKPNGNNVNCTYDNASRITKIKDYDHAIINENGIIYEVDNVKKMLGGTKGYSIVYDEYNFPSIYNTTNGTTENIFIRFVNQLTNETDTSTTRYNNDYSEQSVFDKYGNLILKKYGTYGQPLSNELEFYYSDDSVDNISTDDPNSSIINKSSISKLRKVVDKRTNNTQKYYYNDDGLLEKVTNTANDNVDTSEYTYDNLDRIVTKKIIHNDTESTTTITYRDSNLYDTQEVAEIENAIQHTYNNQGHYMIYGKSYAKDSLKRLSIETLQVGDYSYEKNYIYQSSQVGSTSSPKTIEYKLKNLSSAWNIGSINYTYDSTGNITKVDDMLTDSITIYQYDDVGRLQREDNQRLGTTKIFYYDNNGNIRYIYSTSLTDEEDITNANVTEFVYDSVYPDRLIRYKGGNVSYDVNGNITSISDYSFGWTRGRLLSSCTKGSKTYTFSYNGLGQRIQKRYSSNNYVNYVYDGDKLVKEHRVNGSDVYDINYIYLGNEIVGFAMKDKYYYFIKNLQGDIINLVNSTNNVVATYVYDAWGNCKACDNSGVENTTPTWVGNINPFRYRGYYYDVETGLFWCNSRYYNPEWGRWISPDSIEYLNPQSINGLNLYAYCGNDPVNRYDPNGHDPLPWWANMLIGVGVIAVLAAATVLTAGAAGVGVGAAFAAGFTGTAVGAGASGLAVTIAGSAFAGAVIGGTTSMLASGIMTAAMGGTTEDILNSASSSFMFGTALGAFSGIVNPISMAANEAVNIGIHMGINSLATVGTYLGQTAYMDGNLNNVSFGGLLITAIGGASGGFLPNSVASSGYYNYISIQGATFFDFVYRMRRSR